MLYAQNPGTSSLLKDEIMRLLAGFCATRLRLVTAVPRPRPNTKHEKHDSVFRKYDFRNQEEVLNQDVIHILENSEIAFVESYYSGGGTPTRKLYGLYSVLQYSCARHGHAMFARTHSQPPHILITLLITRLLSGWSAHKKREAARLPL
jgi:hypothetical protein